MSLYRLLYISTVEKISVLYEYVNFGTTERCRSAKSTVGNSLYCILEYFLLVFAVPQHSCSTLFLGPLFRAEIRLELVGGGGEHPSSQREQGTDARGARSASWLVSQSDGLSRCGLAKVGKYVLNKFNLAYINATTNLLC